MRHTTRWLLSALVSIASLLCGPTAGNAQSAPPASRLLTVDEVHAAFVGAGYIADPITDWDWTIPPVSSFVVHDPASDRVLMVLVFPSTAAAALFRGYAATHDQTDSQTPLLVTGYGPSTWRDNVSMVQSTQSQLAAFAKLETDREHGIDHDSKFLLAQRAASMLVDVDFQDALQSSTINV